MRSDGVPKTIVECNADGRWRKGKPKEQRMDGVRKSMVSKNLKKDAKDRELWRSKISVGPILL